MHTALIKPLSSLFYFLFKFLDDNFFFKYQLFYYSYKHIFLLNRSENLCRFTKNYIYL